MDTEMMLDGTAMECAIRARLWKGTWDKPDSSHKRHRSPYA
jgi:hypothetical protein